jgi:hypothetical protein
VQYHKSPNRDCQATCFAATTKRLAFSSFAALLTVMAVIKISCDAPSAAAANSGFDVGSVDLGSGSGSGSLGDALSAAAANIGFNVGSVALGSGSGSGLLDDGHSYSSQLHRTRTTSITPINMKLDEDGEGFKSSNSYPMEQVCRGKRMPRFFVVGTQKAATSTFYLMLWHHPKIEAADIKETNFFYRLFKKDHHWNNWTWYESLFPSLEDGQDPNDGEFTGDFSIYSFFDPQAALRVKLAAPNAKILVLVRDPVARMYSEYQMRVRSPNTKGRLMSFDEAVTRAIALWESCFAKHINAANSALLECVHPAEPVDSMLWEFIGRGLYYEQSKVWLAVYPREQLLFMDFVATLSEKEATADALVTALRFIGVAEDEIYWPWGDYSRDEVLAMKNIPVTASNKEADYEPMSDWANQTLTSFFQPHNQRFVDLVGQGFVWADRF